MFNNSINPGTKNLFRALSSNLPVPDPVLCGQRVQHEVLKENSMHQQIHRTLMMIAIALLCSITTVTIWAQQTTNSSGKMSSHQMMDKMNHMSTAEKAAMFDKMTETEKMQAMKMAGHDMSKMSHQERMDMMSKMTEEQKADMFEKMPMDTKMATMRMSMKEHKAVK